MNGFAQEGTALDKTAACPPLASALRGHESGNKKGRGRFSAPSCSRRKEFVFRYTGPKLTFSTCTIGATRILIPGMRGMFTRTRGQAEIRIFGTTIRSNA